MPASSPLPGYKKANSMVYCGMYPLDGGDYENLKTALEKLKLNDTALNYETETSIALGFGFRCGFLGLLHLEIIQERLEREFDLSLITTAPSVIYKVYKTDGEVVELYNPTDLPPLQEIRPTGNTAPKTNFERPRGAAIPVFATIANKPPNAM